MVAGQFINALVAIIDKYIVTSRTVARPVVYAFYITVLSGISIVIFLFGTITIPFANYSLPSIENVYLPSFLTILMSVFGSISLFFALTTMYSAFKKSDASDVVPVIGSSSAVFVLILGFLLLGLSLPNNFALGFTLLIIGTLSVSHFRFRKVDLLFSVLSGFFFAVNILSAKILFVETNFDNGFFWLSVGYLIIPLFILFSKEYREKILNQPKITGKSGGALVIVNKILAGVAAFLILKAIDIGNPSIVQALAGLQFAFLLFFSILFGKHTPHEFGENINWKEGLQKFFSIVIIVLGFFVLFS